jgi:hypothetical protein
METQNVSLVEALLQEGGAMSADDIAVSAGLRRDEAAKAASRLIEQGRATWDASALTYVATFAPIVRDAQEPDVSTAALALLRPGMTSGQWRRECEAHGYGFDADELARIAEDLEADGLLTRDAADARFAEESAWEDGYEGYPDYYASETAYYPGDHL